ncbi:SLAP domain-containing protein [Aneurinibacillus sp. REN35]|uniref:SLAP domain-containing protein n=1 Tax=Aneurinibacillus sp. REN35 TaxID=3237286 RepID=UPI003529C874
MISILKKWRSNRNKEEQEQPVIQEEIHEIKEEVAVEEPARMQLVFPESVRPSFEQDDIYVLQFASSELPEIEQGVLAIDGFKLKQEFQGFSVQAFIRNTMADDVTIDKLPLVLKDADGKLLAHHVFELDEAMRIPQNSMVPWRSVFPYPSFITSNGNLSAWHVAFYMKGGETHTRITDLNFETSDQSWQQQSQQVDSEVMEGIQKALAQTEGMVHILGLSAAVRQDGGIDAMVALRNDRDEAVYLEDNTVFALVDAQGNELASHTFDLSHIELPPHSASPYTLLFPKESVQVAGDSLEEWALIEK